MTTLCHILEGTNAGSTLGYMACGRAMKHPGEIGHYVGRAWILKGVWLNTVTCERCRKKYGLGPLPVSVKEGVSK